MIISLHLALIYNNFINIEMKSSQNNKTNIINISSLIILFQIKIKILKYLVKILKITVRYDEKNGSDDFS